MTVCDDSQMPSLTLFLESHCAAAASMFDHGVVAPFDEIYSYRGRTITDHRPGARPLLEALERDGTLPTGPSANDIARGAAIDRRRVQGRVLKR